MFIINFSIFLWFFKYYKYWLNSYKSIAIKLFTNLVVKSYRVRLVAGWSNASRDKTNLL